MEPLKPSPLPDRPWQRLAADLCEFQKQMFLITIDYHSRWIEIDKLNSTTSNAVIGKLKRIFTTHGIPDSLRTDNGPQFASTEFANFATQYGFLHDTSSPHVPQANGMAERAVQTAKKILAQRNSDLALLNYRDTPHSATGVSPAEALMGRRLKTRLPVLAASLAPKVPDQEHLKERDRAAKAVYKEQYDRRHGARPLPGLVPGQQVAIKLDSDKTWTEPGKVILADQPNRSYLVTTPSGTVRRHRTHLRPVPPASPRPLPPPQVSPAVPAAPVPVALPTAPPTPPPRSPVPVVAPVPSPAPLRRSARTIVKPPRFR